MRLHCLDSSESNIPHRAPFILYDCLLFSKPLLSSRWTQSLSSHCPFRSQHSEIHTSKKTGSLPSIHTPPAFTLGHTLQHQVHSSYRKQSPSSVCLLLFCLSTLPQLFQNIQQQQQQYKYGSVVPLYIKQVSIRRITTTVFIRYLQDIRFSPKSENHLHQQKVLYHSKR